MKVSLSDDQLCDVRETSAGLAETAPLPREEPQNSCRGIGCLIEIRVRYWKDGLVEAAGVEPASENVTGQETTCLFAFMPLALPKDVRDRRSERTRNGCR
jgi:hypothetical protein